MPFRFPPKHCATESGTLLWLFVPTYTRPRPTSTAGGFTMPAPAKLPGWPPLSGRVYVFQTISPERLSSAVRLPRKVQQGSTRCKFSCEETPTRTRSPATTGLPVTSDHLLGSRRVIQRRSPVRVSTAMKWLPFWSPR